MMHDMWHDGWMMGGGVGMWMTIILAVGSIALIGVWASRALVTASGPKSDDALDILDKRLARGEIDEEEYQRKRDQLRGLE